MEEILHHIIEGIKGYSLLEGIAVLSGLAYIGLATRESILCWYAAMLGNVLFIIIFFDAALYTKVPLRAYYLLMAFYGLYEWKKGAEEGAPAPIRTLRPSYHALGIVTCTIAGTVLAFSLARWTDASMPYLDSLTTVFSLFTTWMVARKYLENWIYWIAIDGVSIYLYASQELYQTAFLYIIFTIMAIIGIWNWGRRYQKEAGSV